MTVKKAIKILDWWIEQKKSGMQKLLEEWNHDSIDKTQGIEKSLLSMDETVLSNLEIIRNEIVPKCKHQKNYTIRVQMAIYTVWVVI